MLKLLHTARGLALAALLLAPAPALAGPEELVNAEHAFAHEAATAGVRDAFLHWLSPAAVLLNPRPVNAHKLYQSKPASPAKLAWEPVVAVMSGAGDYGWTTGPWEWRRDSSQAEPEAYGEFVSVWHRQSDGSLRNVLDCGIDHAAPQGAKPVLQAAQLAAVPSHQGALGSRHGLWKADADFAMTASAQGLAAALAGAAAPDLRWLHDGSFPVLGREAARDSAAKLPQQHMASAAQFIANSGDLGYTWGTLGGANADSSYYLHIWQRAPGRPWELKLELLLPVPPAKQ